MFSERYEHCRALAASHGIDHDGGFRLLSMEKRWGSCTPQGLLLLNPALVSAPRECIDYVITHELVHTVEHNHGTHFYRLLTALMPDWQDRQRRLNETTEPIRLCPIKCNKRWCKHRSVDVKRLPLRTAGRSRQPHPDRVGRIESSGRRLDSTG